LADKMDVGGPELFILRLLCGVVAAVAYGGHVVGQGVEPNVDDVLLLGGAGCWFGDGDAPVERAAGDREVFEGSGEVGGAFGGEFRLGAVADVATKEAQDFVASCF